MLKIAAVAGSPRTNSNSTALLQAVLEGASATGAEQQIFHLKD
ncbi:MAG: NAD(P)H-dependent oxidoreductase, partial [Planctomycetes bacterium]|nr:NAD(P)H-dependent oxidoreductase [Planctomycetota bacterium]